MKSVVKMCQVSKVYGENETEVYALRNIHLDIEEGTFVTIVGKSGSGKSTLLHVMGGLEKPNSGEVIIQDISLYEDRLALFFNFSILYQVKMSMRTLFYQCV